MKTKHTLQDLEVKWPKQNILLNVLCLELIGWSNISPSSPFGYSLEGDFNGEHLDGLPWPTTDPAAAMEVLKKCLEKDAYATGQWIKGFLKNEILELEICKFAKKLFTK